MRKLIQYCICDNLGNIQIIALYGMLLVMVVNGLSPIQHKAIIKTDIVLSITSFGINLDEISIETKRFLFMKSHFECLMQNANYVISTSLSYEVC